MPSEFTANVEHHPKRVVLEVCSNLNAACTQAIVAQAKKSLRNGTEMIVVDLSKRNGISLLELAVLVDSANEAGLLEKVAFHLSDSAIRRFFLNMKRIKTTMAAAR